MEREYYVLWYRLYGKDLYLIWFSTDEDDGVFVDENGFIPAFDSIEALRNCAKLNNIKIKKEDPRLLDLDIVENWLEGTDNIIENYNPFLDAWNLFEDVSRSTNSIFIKNKYYYIYERIFWSCNIPAITPEGEIFTPTWTKKELKVINEILNKGFQMFKEKVNLQ